METPSGLLASGRRNDAETASHAFADQGCCADARGRERRTIGQSAARSNDDAPEEHALDAPHVNERNLDFGCANDAPPEWRQAEPQAVAINP